MRNHQFLFAAAALWAVAGSLARGQFVAGKLTGGSQNAHFGRSLANAGDLDGDGVDDLLIGEPQFSAPGVEGRVHVVSGRTLAPIRIDVAATTAHELFGAVIASVGDLDSDLVPDYVVGAPRSNGGQGLIEVLSGATGALLWSTQAAAADDRLGDSVAGLGDVDGDGLPDLAAARTGADAVDVYGGTGAFLYTVTGQVDGRFGGALAGLGDVTGDGVPDFAVGEPDYKKATGAVVGRVRVCSGFDGALFRQSTGRIVFGKYGSAVARGHDFDADGRDDLLIGAPGEPNADGDVESGVVIAWSSVRNVELWRNEGIAASDDLGTAATRTLDVDLDGIGDYVTGAPGASFGKGRVELRSGADGSLLAQIDGETGASSSSFGFGSALLGGDWNGDAIGDWAIGFGSYADSNAREFGAAFVVLGCPATASSYGAGWPGTNGVPSLDCTLVPSLGQRCEIQIGNSKNGLTLGVIQVGFAEASIPTSADGTLLLVPAFSFPFYVLGASTTFWGDIPDDPSLCFLDFFVQALEVDPGASQGLSFTAGLELTVGFEMP